MQKIDWIWQWFCRKFSYEVNVFLLLSLLGKGHGPSCEHNWHPFTHKSYVLNLVEVGPVVLEKIFKSSKCIFTIFQLSPPLRRMWPFIWPNLNPLHQRILRAKFGWNWPSGSGEDFYKLSIHFWYFPIIILWERRGLSLCKLESLSLRDTLWLEMNHVRLS